MTQEFDLTKEVYPNQLAKELVDAGLDRGFILRNSDGKNIIIFIDDDKKVSTVLENHTPDKEVEDSLITAQPTSEEIKQTQTDEIDAITTISGVRAYLKKDKGLI